MSGRGVVASQCELTFGLQPNEPVDLKLRSAQVSYREVERHLVCFVGITAKSICGVELERM